MTFIDEREESLNDGYFAINMRGFAPGNAWNGEVTQLTDLPAYWHDRAASVTFGDGHVDVQRWQDPRTTPDPTRGQIPLGVPSPQNRDVLWLQEHATRAAVDRPL
jgi:prepilin-type processing-associated H-X9-DG protein